MNNTIETILKRRSVRAFEKKQITDIELELILQAGISAPSAMNQQSPLLVVLQNEELIKELCDITKEEFPKRTNPFFEAPTIVIVFADFECIYPIQDASSALENMFIAATSLNIGSCWINYLKDLMNTKAGIAFQTKLGIEEKYKVVGTCVLGYPKNNEWPPVKERKKDYVRIFK